MLMMDIEDHLKKLDSDIAIVLKGEALRAIYEEDAYRQLQALLKRIVKAVENKEIQLL